jgi:hypothetical protein
VIAQKRACVFVFFFAGCGIDRAVYRRCKNNQIAPACEYPDSVCFLLGDRARAEEVSVTSGDNTEGG